MINPGSRVLRVAALTHVGGRRQSNEDCIVVGSRVRSASMNEPWVVAFAAGDASVCLVADGMGGHPAGDVASRMVAEHLSAALPPALADNAALVAALRHANQLLFKEMTRFPALAGMGTTIAGIALAAGRLIAFNVGDSRIYRVLDKTIEQLSIDHSESVITPFTTFEFPTRALSQCLGGFSETEEVEPHVTRVAAEPGSRFLICSDGLHDMLSDQRIAECLSADLRDSVMTLFECAMAEGGNDNISIILARVEG